MTRPPRPNYLALILSVIAGLGHLLAGRPRRGLVLFVCATGCWNLAFLSLIAPTPPLGTWSLRLGLAVAGGLTTFAMFDVFRLAVYARLPRVVATRHRLFQEGVTLYLGRRWAEARRIWDRLLDMEPGDPLVRLYMASLERRAGHPDRALVHARRALRTAPHSPMRAELEQEILLARAARRRRS
jgi:hypothetical protein